MKKQLINEIKRMQQLAGILTEGLDPNMSIIEYAKILVDSYYEGLPEWDLNDLESTKDDGKIEKFEVSYEDADFDFNGEYPFEDLDQDVKFEFKEIFDKDGIDKTVKGLVTLVPGEEGLEFSIYYSPKQVSDWNA
jgi:hypothetical protein